MEVFARPLVLPLRRPIGQEMVNPARNAGGGGAGPLKVLLVGSSTPFRYFTEYTGPQNDNVSASSDGTNFSLLGTTGAGACYLGDELYKALGRPIKFIKAAINTGARLSEWEANGNSYRSAAVAAALAAGGVDLIISIVGFNDPALDASVVSQASHLALYRSFLTKLRTEINQPNVPVFIGGTQKLNDMTANKQAQMVWVRGAELQIADDANNRFYGHAYDLAQHVDGIHMADGPTYGIHAKRGAAQIAALLKGTAQSRGPYAVSAMVVDNVTTDVTIAHRSGNDFTPSTAITDWFVSVDNFVTRLTVSAAVRIDATTVRLTHATTGGVAPKVAYARTGAVVVTGVLKDNSPLTLPMDPVVADITAVLPKIVKIATGYTPKSIDGADAPSGWNTLQGASTAGGTPQATVSNLLDTAGNNTGFGFTLTNNAEGGNNFGSASGAGIFKDVLRYNLVDSALDKEIDFEITGLDNSKVYDIYMSGSRDTVTGRNVNYQINALPVQTLDVGSNTGNVVSFVGVAPTSGKITGKVTLGSGNSTAVYLSGIYIRERTP